MRRYRIEGYAIISIEGMIASADGTMPASIKNDADQQFFSDGLDRADILVHGRFSHEHQRHSGDRKRLMLTRRVAALAPDPAHPQSLLWNPAGMPFEEACAAHGVTSGDVAIVGGTDVFGMFLDLGYDAFHLTRAARASIPDGRPVFPGVPAETPEDLMTRQGLRPTATLALDAAAEVTMTSWTRGEDT